MENDILISKGRYTPYPFYDNNFGGKCSQTKAYVPFTSKRSMYNVGVASPAVDTYVCFKSNNSQNIVNRTRELQFFKEFFDQEITFIELNHTTLLVK